MTYVRPEIAGMNGYVPGEQPRGREKFIKLNTNENPYPCSPAVAGRSRRWSIAGCKNIPTRWPRRFAGGPPKCSASSRIGFSAATAATIS